MTQTIRSAIVGGVVVGLAALVVSCGDDSSPSSPSPTPTPPGPTVNTTTITLTSSGASPRDITVPVGSRVTFVNNDSAPHDMNSDPHPAHTECPDINVGFISGGQSRATNNLNAARTCRYHDHNQPSNTSLQGTIRIQ